MRERARGKRAASAFTITALVGGESPPSLSSRNLHRVASRKAAGAAPQGGWVAWVRVLAPTERCMPPAPPKPKGGLRFEGALFVHFGSCSPRCPSCSTAKSSAPPNAIRLLSPMAAALNVQHGASPRIPLPMWRSDRRVSNLLVGLRWALVNHSRSGPV